MAQRPESAEGPLKVISQQQIGDLWAAGFTIIPRTLFGRDPYATADAIKRPGMAQQWGDKAQEATYRAQGWKIVYREDWHGLFAPFGQIGEVEIDGLVLMRRPQHEVDRVHAENHAKAHKNVEDWIDRNAGDGFSVEIKESGKDTVRRNVNGALTLDTTVGIPRDMQPHIGVVLAERDRICSAYANGEYVAPALIAAFDQALQNNPQAEKWPLLRSIVLPTAIENVRAQLKQGGSNAEEENRSTDRFDGQPADACGTGRDNPAVDAGGPDAAAGADGAATGAATGNGTSAGEP